jgi:vitamin-K-epoxide reductase (warfarin-sensitive)
MTRRLDVAVVILCIVGAALSAVSLRDHYATSTTDYCDLNETFNCDLVNRSSYSQLMGAPVALIGLMGYVFLATLSMNYGRAFTALRVLAAFLGLLFALYLAYIEAYVLAVWCLLCIGSLMTIAGVCVLSLIALVRMRSRSTA